MVVLVVQTGDHFCQNGNGVGHGAAIYTAVQVAVGAGYFHFNITEATQTNIKAGGV